MAFTVDKNTTPAAFLAAVAERASKASPQKEKGMMRVADVLIAVKQLKPQEDIGSSAVGQFYKAIDCYFDKEGSSFKNTNAIVKELIHLYDKASTDPKRQDAEIPSLRKLGVTLLQRGQHMQHNTRVTLQIAQSRIAGESSLSRGLIYIKEAFKSFKTQFKQGVGLRNPELLRSTLDAIDGTEANLLEVIARATEKRSLPEEKNLSDAKGYLIDLINQEYLKLSREEKDKYLEQIETMFSDISQKIKEWVSQT